MYAQSEKISGAGTVNLEINAPDANGAFNVEGKTCDDVGEIFENLCKGKVDLALKEQTADVYKNCKMKGENFCKSEASDDSSEESGSEIEYASWCLASKSQQYKETNTQNTKVIDLPQFILVLTAFKAEDTVIIPPNDLLPEYVQVERERKFPSKRTYSKAYDIKSKNREIIRKHKALIKKKCPIIEVAAKTDETKHVHRIKYVRYSSSVNAVRREREIQVSEKECRTNDVSVQCDLDEDVKPPTEENPEVKWINHIIEAHMLNDDANIYECHICGEIALSYASKERHSLIHENDSLLCFQCGRNFQKPDELRSHEKMHGRNKFEIKKALRCPKLYCTKAFHSKKQLFNHIDEHANKTEERCSKCQRSFHSLFQYHMHKSKRNCWR